MSAGDLYSAVRIGLVRALEATLIGGFAALTLDVLWGVFSRFVLASQSPWTEELAIYLLIWVSLLGASLAYAERGHLGVDALVSRLDPAARKIAEVVAELCVASFAGGVLLHGGLELVRETLASGQLSPALGIEMGYVYLAAPISGAFLLLFSLESLVGRGEPPLPAEGADAEHPGAPGQEGA